MPNASAVGSSEKGCKSVSLPCERGGIYRFGQLCRPWVRAQDNRRRGDRRSINWPNQDYYDYGTSWSFGRWSPLSEWKLHHRGSRSRWKQNKHASATSIPARKALLQGFHHHLRQTSIFKGKIGVTACRGISGVAGYLEEAKLIFYLKWGIFPETVFIVSKKISWNKSVFYFRGEKGPCLSQQRIYLKRDNFRSTKKKENIWNKKGYLFRSLQGGIIHTKLVRKMTKTHHTFE